MNTETKTATAAPATPAIGPSAKGPIDVPRDAGREDRRASLRAGVFVISGLLFVAVQATAQSNDKTEPRTSDKSATAFDLLRDRDYVRALEQFKRDNASYPRIAPLIDGQAWCEFFLGQLDRAEEGFKKALEVDPSYKWSKDGVLAVAAARKAPLEAAAAAHRAGAYAEARVLYEKIAAGKTAAPPSYAADALAGEGRALLALGRYDEAAKIFNQALQKRPNFAEAYKGIGYCAYYRRKHADALTPFLMALKADPTDAACRIAAAWCRYFKKEYAEAEKEFLAAAASPADSAAAWYGVGWSREMKKDEAPAAEAFSRAVGFDPAMFDADLRALAAAKPAYAGLFREAGWSSLRNGKDAWAAAEWNAVLAALPRDPEARLGAAFAAFRLADYAGAVAACDALIAEGFALAPVFPAPTSSGGKVDLKVDARALRAWAKLKLGLVADAVEGFKAVVAADGSRADARSGLGWAVLAAGDAPTAESHFREAGKLAPGLADAAKGLAAVDGWRRAAYYEGWAAIDAHRFDAAEKIFADLKTATDGRFPKSDLPLVDAALGYSRKAAGDGPGAEAAFAAALAADPKCGLALKGLGLLRIEARSYGSAAERLRPLTEDPAYAGDYEVHAALGIAELGVDRLDQAESALLAALKLKADHAPAFDALGWVEKRRNKNVEARLYFERAIALDPVKSDTPDLRDAMKNVREFHKLYAPFGWAWLRIGKNDKAEADFRDAVRLDPREPETPRGLGLARLRLGDVKEAGDLFTKYFSKAAPKENPWGVLSATASEWGWGLYFAGKFGEAEAVFQKLAALHAGETLNYADPFDGLGWCALRRKQWDRAKENFLKAIAIAPRHESSLKGLETLQSEAP